MLKLLCLAELVDINTKFIASNTSLMMSLSVGYPQILASGYPDSKFTIRFSPTYEQKQLMHQPHIDVSRTRVILCANYSPKYIPIAS